jgi:hypothetical protein
MSGVSFAGDLATTVNADGSSVIGIVGSPGILGDFGNMFAYAMQERAQPTLILLNWVSRLQALRLRLLTLSSLWGTSHLRSRCHPRLQ